MAINNHHYIAFNAAAIQETIKLIEEYLFQGGAGFDEALLDEMRGQLADALAEV